MHKLQTDQRRSYANSSSPNYLRTLLLALTAAFALAACGGGGGGGKSADKPKPTQPTTPPTTTQPTTPSTPATPGAGTGTPGAGGGSSGGGTSGGGGSGGGGSGGGGSGGGGGGGTPATPAAPTQQPTLQISAYGVKSYTFSWTPVAEASFYKLYVSEGGSEVMLAEQGGTTFTRSLDDALLHTRLTGHYRVEACNAGGCKGSAVITPDVNKAIGYLKASNTGANDGFGVAVALAADGNTLAVGAYGEASNAKGVNQDQTNNTADQAGAVYVFARNSAGRWAQQAYLKASNAGAEDGFGWALTLSADGNRLAVGAPQEASNATGINGDQSDNSAAQAGAVYVFARSGTSWSQQSYLKGSNTETGDHFGWALTLSADGNRLAVGAPQEASNATGINGDESNNDSDWAGAAYVFTYNGAVWSQQAYVKASNAGANDFFGHSLALAADGRTLAVGARGESSNAKGIDGDQTNNGANAAGAVYVFAYNAANWEQQAYLKASNTDGGDEFGIALALAANGNTLAVGATGENSNATGINGDESNNSADDAGAAYVFTRSGTNWAQQAYVKASNTKKSNSFATSLTLSTDGKRLAVGADGESSKATGIGGDQTDNSAAQAGAVYVFAHNGTNWAQQSYLKASNAEASDSFGNSVALAGNGATLAVGARGESSKAKGIGGDQSDNSAGDAGAVYLY